MNLILPVFLLSTSLLSSGCGPLDLTGSKSILNSGSINDPSPNGTPLKQAQIFGLSGKAVSGTALIFSQNSSNPASSTGLGSTGAYPSTGPYLVRLEGLQTPEEIGLTLQITSSPGNRIDYFNLKASSGNQNYTISTSDALRFISVKIYSPLNSSFYGSAIFP